MPPLGRRSTLPCTACLRELAWVEPLPRQQPAGLEGLSTRVATRSARTQLGAVRLDLRDVALHPREGLLLQRCRPGDDRQQGGRQAAARKGVRRASAGCRHVQQMRARRHPATCAALTVRTRSCDCSRSWSQSVRWPAAAIVPACSRERVGSCRQPGGGSSGGGKCTARHRGAVGCMVYVLELPWAAGRPTKACRAFTSAAAAVSRPAHLRLTSAERSMRPAIARLPELQAAGSWASKRSAAQALGIV